MPDRRTAHEIEDVAVDWAARAERGLTSDERSKLDIWLEQDTRHLGAFVRAQAAWIHAERASALGRMPEAEPQNASPEQIIAPSLLEEPLRRRLTRRMLVGGGGALAASLAAAWFLGFERDQSLESGVGEIRRIALAGGTMLTLDTDTRIDIVRSSQDRQLELVRGKLFLDVPHTAGSPIVVKAGDLLLETIQGAFGLEALLGEPIAALVTRGQLTVSQQQSVFSDRTKRTISTGEQMAVARGGDLAATRVKPLAAAERERLLAWRDGLLSFGGETLADAALAFARYNVTRIVVTDPQLARQRVTGLFKASDPRGFADAVAASFGGVVSIQGDIIRLASGK